VELDHCGEVVIEELSVAGSGLDRFLDCGKVIAFALTRRGAVLPWSGNSCVGLGDIVKCLLVTSSSRFPVGSGTELLAERKLARSVEEAVSLEMGSSILASLVLPCAKLDSLRPLSG